jgi:hypothetical protein
LFYLYALKIKGRNIDHNETSKPSNTYLGLEIFKYIRGAFSGRKVSYVGYPNGQLMKLYLEE